jgi:glycosyltransferase involved in cell wall biosynthesis
VFRRLPARFVALMTARRLKVAYIVTRGDDLGGAQVHVRDVAAAMRERGHAATVLCGPAGIFTDELAERGLPFRCLPHLVRPIDPGKDALALMELRGAMRELRPDLVSLHSSKTRLLGAIAARMSGIPVLATVHGWPFADAVPERRRKFYVFYERQAARLATAVVTVSHYDKDLAERHRVGARGRITVVHNGMPDDPRQRDHHLASNPVRLLMVGRHSPQKDHPALFRALAELRDHPWTIELVGTGPAQDRHEAMARELGFAQRVSFLGYRKDVPDLMATADGYVLVSNWEGLPRSIIEAMRAGLATISSDVGGCREVVRDHETGYLVPRGDATALARRLADLIDGRQKRRILGANARRLFEQEFTFEKMFGRTLAVYRQILAAPPRLG